MSRWRIYTVLALMVVPVLILTAYGGYALWKEFWWGAWIWVPMTVSMAVGWFLAWFWQRNKTLLRPVNFEPNVHWTERDQQAWKLVQARARGPRTSTPTSSSIPNITWPSPKKWAWRWPPSTTPRPRIPTAV